MVLVVFLFVIALLVRRQVIQMDGRWFQPSLQGVQGLALYLFGDYSGAAKAYRAHFKHLCETRRTWGHSAREAFVCGDLYTAKQTAAKTLKTNSSAMDSLLTLGEVALAERDFDRALGFFDRVLEKETDQFDALLLSSVAHARTGRYGKAIEALNRGLRRGRIESRMTAFLAALETTGNLARLPADSRPLCLLAHYHRYLRIFDESNGKTAIAYAKKAIEAGDRPDDAYLTLGIVHARQGKWEAGLRAFLAAIEINPNHAEALAWAGRRYLERGDLATGYRMLKTAFAAAPSDLFYAELLYDVAMERLGDYPQALELARAMHHIKPDQVKSLWVLGHIYHLMGDDAQSVKHYREAASLDPSNPVFLENLGLGLRNLGRIDEAISAFSRARDIAPSRPLPHTQLGYLYLWERSPKEAVGEFEQAMRLGGFDWHTFGGLCHAYQANLDFEGGARCWQAFSARYPNEVVPLPSLPEALNNMWVQGRRR